MLINKEKCIGCGFCVIYCPVTAISIINGKADIDQEKCLECGNCGRQRIVKCPKGAIYENPHVFERPRSIRKYFSDPMATHVETKIPGRGTEEVKTNDVTGRVKKGQIGIAIEVGRPCLGASFSDIEIITKVLSKFEIQYEKLNPLTHFMKDEKKGVFTEEAKKARVISAIIEFVAPEEQFPSIIKTLKSVQNDINTVFSLDVIARFTEANKMPLLAKFSEVGLSPRPNSKINLGLGLPLKQSGNMSRPFFKR